jgi:hypothetical protein
MVIETRECKSCHEIKDLTAFRCKIRNGNSSYERACKTCTYKQNYKTTSSKPGFKERKKQIDREYYLDNTDQCKQNAANHRANNKAKRRANDKERRKRDPAFRLRNAISSIIWRALKNHGSKKHGSFTKYVPYTLAMLVLHIESKFEWWMTWDNQGLYDKKAWNENDPTTWTWQLDHIIPHSEFLYVSMEDEEFKRCWALENLRPYPANLNSIDGAQRVRHNQIQTME